MASRVYKLIMSKGDAIYLTGDALDEVGASQDQLKKITDYKGNLLVLNKAHIVQAQIDTTVKESAIKPFDSHTQERIEATKKRYGKED